MEVIATIEFVKEQLELNGINWKLNCFINAKVFADFPD